MCKINLEERVVVKLGSILQSRNATREDVLAAYAEAEYNCDEENIEVSEPHQKEQK